jgi:L-ectoine synthase
MIVRTLQDAVAGPRRIDAPNWNSVRLSLKDDGMGFSFHVTTIYAGTETPIWYRHHLEAVYCIAGEGEVETVEDGRVYPIRPGTVYLLDQHDKHLLRARTEMTMACVFNPPLHGSEVHDENGVYPREAEPVADA